MVRENGYSKAQLQALTNDLFMQANDKMINNQLETRDATQAQHQLLAACAEIEADEMANLDIPTFSRDPQTRMSITAPEASRRLSMLENAGVNLQFVSRRANQRNRSQDQAHDAPGADLPF